MTDEQSTKAVFLELLELPAGERADHLERVYGDDPALCARVAALLRDYERAGGFMEEPTIARPEAIELPDGAAIGNYRIVHQIGEGGFGVVYRAEQVAPIRREVALKIIKIGLDTKQFIARFEAERQAVALMDHPGIAKVLDAGATEAGRPFFVMELVRGLPITEYCDKQKLSIRDRLTLFAQVCQAVQHAHQKGIIHRDLKPSNILVMIQDGEPIPKVIDFGIAKAIQQPLTEKTMYTAVGELVGTPDYMSPEQADAGRLDVDTRSDIYSLGVLLYELLTGARPFDFRQREDLGLDGIRRLIVQDEPPTPSTRFSQLGEHRDDVARDRSIDTPRLRDALRGDLDWIIMKAMEKDRTRRYASASDLAQDVERHLRFEPVSAGPPGAGYRLSRFARRNRGWVAAGAIVGLVLLAGVAATTWQARVATKQLNRAVNAEQEQSRLRAEAEAVSEQLQAVVTFQSHLLSGVDAGAMGRSLFDDLRARVRAALTADQRPAPEIDATLAAFDDLTRGVNPTDMALTLIDQNVLSRAAETIATDFSEQPLLQAELQETIADTYQALGLLDRALSLNEAAFAIRRAELGLDHRDTLRSLDMVGGVMLEQGRLDEAEAPLRDALARRGATLGDRHPDTLISLSKIGLLEWRRGDYAEAERATRESLAGLRVALGDDHSDTMNTLENLAGIVQLQGRFDEAEDLHREVLERKQRVLGRDHPNALTALANMASLHRARGEIEEAERCFREVLEMRRRILGAEHPATLNSANSLGLLLQNDGRLAEAEPYIRTATEGQRRVLGADHPDTLISTNNLALLLMRQEKYAEAEPYYREALRGFRRLLGDEHPNTLFVTNNLGALLNDMSRFDDAADLLAPAEPAVRRVFVDGNARYLGTFLATLGEARAGQGAFEDAESALLEAHRLIEAGFGATDHDRTTATIGHLVRLYEAWDAEAPDQGYDAKAAEWDSQASAGPAS